MSKKISFTYNQSIDLVTKELENTKVGQEAGTKITGKRNIILGTNTAFNCLDINDSIIAGYRVGFDLTSSSSNLVYITNNGLQNINKDYNSVIIGSKLLNNIIEGEDNLILGFNQFNDIKTNITNTITYGNNIGNHLQYSKNNIIIGTDNLSNVITATDNIFIGNFNKSQNDINSNIITIGNKNNLEKNSLIIGNENTITTKTSTIIGNNLRSFNKLIANNHLNYYDVILNNNIIKNLKLSNLIVEPIDNYIFKSPYNPSELSLNNNLNLKTLNFTFDTLTTIKEPNDTKYMYNVTYRLTDNPNDIYRFPEPTIVYFNFTTNQINLKYDNIDKNLDYKVFITELPKYNFIEKLVYDLDETITLIPYKEYNHIREDNFKVNFIINYKDIRFQSRYQFTINVFRIPNNNLFVPSIFYSSLVAFEWFNIPLNVTKLKSDILINDIGIKYQNSIINQDFNVYGDSILINDNIIHLINIIEHYEVDINLVWYLFSNNLFYISNNIIDGYIYIERPPKQNIITTNLIKINSNIVNFDYFLNSDDIDTITVRIINKDKTKISKSFTVTIKNYIINRLLDGLTLNLIADNYYIDNKVINNPVNSTLLLLVNTCNILKQYEEIDYPKQIINNIDNMIIIDIYPFNQINIFEELIKLGLKNITESNIYILNNSQLQNGYIKSRNYINYRNVNDSLNILIAINRLNYNINNVYTIKFNVINSYFIEYYTQYIYNEYELLKTLNVVNHPKDKIQIDEDFNITLLSLKKISKDFKPFRVIFGDNVVNINLDFYPTINDFTVLYNEYYFKQLFSITELETLHSITYLFNDIQNYKISLKVFIRMIFNILKYSFKIILNNNIELLYNENSDLQYNTENVILIDDRYTKTLNSVQIVYKLSDNIINNNSNLINYFLEIQFSDLLVEYNIDLGNNILYGKDVECKGYDNIGIGSLYNLYGNNSVVIGNRIGDSFINNSVIIGNDNLNDVIPRNVIMIGNNNYNDIGESYLNFDKIAQNNPIVIGHNLQFKDDTITNINDVLIEKEDKVLIGKKGKKVIIGNKFNNLIYISSLTIDKYHSEREIIKDNQEVKLTNFNIHTVQYFEHIKCQNGILAPNGNIYFICNNKIVYYDNNDNKLNSIAFTNELYSNGILGANGKIYLISSLSNYIGVLDPKNNKITKINIKYSKYSFGLLAQDGKIYFIPYDNDYMGEFDILTNTFNVINIDYVGYFTKGILAPNGKIYMISNNTLGVFDIVSKQFKVENIKVDGKDENFNNCNSILYLPTGGILITTNVKAISFNPLTMEGKVYNNLNSNNTLNLCANGRIYGIENGELFELLISHNRKIKYNIGIKSNKMVLGLDNKLYTLPNNDDKIYIINLDIDNDFEYNVEGGISDNWIPLLGQYFNHN